MGPSMMMTIARVAMLLTPVARGISEELRTSLDPRHLGNAAAMAACTISGMWSRPSAGVIERHARQIVPQIGGSANSRDSCARGC